MPKICLISDLHVSYNPRLWKEAFFWEGQGWEVVILNQWIFNKSRKRDVQILQGHNIELKCYCNMIREEISPFRFFFLRLRKRLASEMVKWLKIDLPYSISYAPDSMIKYALKEQADVYSAHAECALYCGVELLKKGKRVFFDFEDWYSRDYLVPERPVRLFRRLEKYALHHGLFTLTTSKVMAEEMARVYETSNHPQVIYNGFKPEDVIELKLGRNDSPQTLKLIWFSRNIGPKRGVERLVDVLNDLDISFELHLLGEITEAYQREIFNRFISNEHKRLILHDFIAHEKLHSFLSSFDIGFAIEENINENRKLTITNKILQYLQAGLKVLATDTAGQREVAGFFMDTVSLVSNEDTGRWGETLIALSKMPSVNRVEQNLRFNEIFSMRAQEEKLKILGRTYLSEFSSFEN